MFEKAASESTASQAKNNAVLCSEWYLVEVPDRQAALLVSADDDRVVCGVELESAAPEGAVAVAGAVPGGKVHQKVDRLPVSLPAFLSAPHAASEAAATYPPTPRLTPDSHEMYELNGGEAI